MLACDGLSRFALSRAARVFTFHLQPYTLYLSLLPDAPRLNSFYVLFAQSRNQHHIHIHHIGTGGSGYHQVLYGLKEMIRIVASEVI